MTDTNETEIDDELPIWMVITAILLGLALGGIGVMAIFGG